MNDTSDVNWPPTDTRGSLAAGLVKILRRESGGSTVPVRMHELKAGDTFWHEQYGWYKARTDGYLQGNHIGTIMGDPL